MIDQDTMTIFISHFENNNNSNKKKTKRQMDTRFYNMLLDRKP